MSTTIKCPQCGNTIEITEAIRQELEAKILKETQAKHEAEIKKLKAQQAQREEQREKEIVQIKLKSDCNEIKVKNIEHQINQLVYKSYSFTPEEIKIAEKYD